MLNLRKLTTLLAAVLAIQSHAGQYTVKRVPEKPRADFNLIAKDLAVIRADLTQRSAGKAPSAWMPDEFIRFSQPLDTASLVTVGGNDRMLLPNLLFPERRTALIGGYDSMFDVELLAKTDVDHKPIFEAGMLFSEWSRLHPKEFFSVVAKERASKSTHVSITNLDVLLVHVLLGGVPAESLSSGPLKADWQLLHQSQNPCYRLIALDKFGSVEQSPIELLALYRECLFNACSYLEACALVEILRRQDYRPEVLALLAEYKASNPVENDGTFTAMRTEFNSLLHGVELVDQRAEDAAKSTANPTTPVATPVGQDGLKSAQTTRPRSASPNPPERAMQAPQIEHGSSSRKWWLLLLSLIIGGAAYRFLWKRN